MKYRVFLLTLLTGLAIAPQIGAQSESATRVLVPLHSSPQSEPLGFEVATVKPSAPQIGDVQASLAICHGVDSKLPVFPPELHIALPALGRCRITNASLRAIVAIAYPSSGPALPVTERVQGGPPWVSSYSFDIEAKSEDASATNAQLISMLRHLLADRFKLEVHTEPKEVNGFELTVAKAGPRLKPGQGDFEGFQFGDGIMSAKNASMKALAQSLTTRVRAPVVDRTGLDGGYEFGLPIPAQNDPAAPSIFTVIQEELGLRLQPAKVSVDTIVIDSAQKPSEN